MLALSLSVCLSVCVSVGPQPVSYSFCRRLLIFDMNDSSDNLSKWSWSLLTHERKKDLFKQAFGRLIEKPLASSYNIDICLSLFKTGYAGDYKSLSLSKKYSVKKLW